MVIRFDRRSTPSEDAEKDHYSGFIVPNDAVFSELLALLPERSDLLSVWNAVWTVLPVRDRSTLIGRITVHGDGTYSIELPESDLPVRTIEKGEITARYHSTLEMKSKVR